MNSLISKFYSAFTELDAEAMVSYYHDDVIFQDPAFGVLKGERAKNMWRMLCQSQKGKDFRVRYSNVTSNGIYAKAHWEAHYNFSQTGRKVHNKIEASFEFKNGLIVRHDDVFDLRAWAKQAMGFKGIVLGGTSYFQRKLHEQTNGMLDKFEAK